jgi:SAM-dependent methyltransferase
MASARIRDVDRARETALNRVCAYFTMFPLHFPYRVLGRAEAGQRVLDPFCGRGTTLYAARLSGLYSLGVDSSPVAVAIAAAKVVATTPRAVQQVLEEILDGADVEVPEGEFWRWAYAPRTLHDLCRLRLALLGDCSTPARVALRAIVMGALHGPQWKTPSHLSNQAPRTFAPKPAYSVRYWKARGMRPRERDVRQLLGTRIERFLAHECAPARGRVLVGDSRTTSMAAYGPFDWIITSPPYYGMKTYVPDQWLRNWFVGGPAQTDYTASGQLVHRSPTAFAADLRRVWLQTAAVARPDARLVVRFGGINDRKANPLEVIRASLEDTPWSIATIKSAGTASAGRRQAATFAAQQAVAKTEYDVWARLR